MSESGSEVNQWAALADQCPQPVDAEIQPWDRASGYDPFRKSGARFCCDAQRRPLVGFASTGNWHETAQLHRTPWRRGVSVAIRGTRPTSGKAADHRVPG